MYHIMVQSHYVYISLFYINMFIDVQSFQRKSNWKIILLQNQRGRRKRLKQYSTFISLQICWESSTYILCFCVLFIPIHKCVKGKSILLYFIDQNLFLLSILYFKTKQDANINKDYHKYNRRKIFLFIFCVFFFLVQMVRCVVLDMFGTKPIKNAHVSIFC